MWNDTFQIVALCFGTVQAPCPPLLPVMPPFQRSYSSATIPNARKNIVHDCFAMMVPFPMLLQAISSSMKNNCLSYVPGPTRGAQRQQKQCSRKEKLSRYCELVNGPKTAPVSKSLLYHSNEHRSCQSATNDQSRSSCQQSSKFEEHHGGQRPSLADSQFCHSQEEVPKEVERNS